jgi:hypothetical protein
MKKFADLVHFNNRRAAEIYEKLSNKRDAGCSTDLWQQKVRHR